VGGALAEPACDRHGRQLAGESPVTGPERRQRVGEGKGARRNSLGLPEEGTTVTREPMRDLKEAVAKIVTQVRYEPLGGPVGRARHRGMPKPDILSVTRPGRGGGWAMKVGDLTR
jgi:hypothetical protein